MATAGGLVFVGRNDGRLTALDSASGKQLWEFQTGAGMHAPAVTFEHKGKQYVLAYSAGAALLGTARGDSVWLFATDGTMGPVQGGSPVPRNAVTISEGRAPGTPLPGGAAPAASLAAANVENGRKLFAQACAVCHGEDGKSGHGAAPSLATVKDLNFAIQTITAGRNTMPAFREPFTADQIRDVSAFVTSVLAR
jgi:mono/diheme cytochrome c family protein